MVKFAFICSIQVGGGKCHIKVGNDTKNVENLCFMGTSRKLHRNC